MAFLAGDSIVVTVKSRVAPLLDDACEEELRIGVAGRIPLRGLVDQQPDLRRRATAYVPWSSAFMSHLIAA